MSLDTLQVRFCRNKSFRRQCIDAFLLDSVRQISDIEKKVVLDLGGTRTDRRGLFDPTSYPWRLVCANIQQKRAVDIVMDAHNFCFNENSFDIVLLTEVIEHLRSPETVLQDIYKTIKPGGKLILTAPFFYHIHGDPDDYGRYTSSGLSAFLTSAGFDEVNIEISPQGGYASSLLYLISKGLNHQTSKGTFLKSRVASLISTLLEKLPIDIVQLDAQANKAKLSGFPHGYGVVAKK